MNQRHIRSRAQERRAAESIGGVTQPQSGAGWSRKNDARSDRWLIECKRTDNLRSISLRLDDLRANEENAVLEHRLPALKVEIAGEEYVVMPEWVFREIQP